MQVSVASCATGEFSATPPPVSAENEDAHITALRLGAWGKENVLRMRKRDACEKRVRDSFAKGGK